MKISLFEEIMISSVSEISNFTFTEEWTDEEDRSSSRTQSNTDTQSDEEKPKELGQL